MLREYRIHDQDVNRAVKEFLGGQAANKKPTSSREIFRFILKIKFRKAPETNRLRNVVIKNVYALISNTSN